LDGLKIAYVGDGGCNTANSTMIGCSSVGMEVTVACPDIPKYSPSSGILKKIKEFTGKSVQVTHDVSEGVDQADVIYTDTWISAGTDEEKEARMEAFPPYQVNMEVVNQAKPGCIVMHCLPAHRDYEITSEVMDSDQSVVFDQAENRMHAQKGLLFWLLNS
jgi:ornithine carbamoyltransferase